MIADVLTKGDLSCCSAYFRAKALEFYVKRLIRFYLKTKDNKLRAELNTLSKKDTVSI